MNFLQLVCIRFPIRNQSSFPLATETSTMIEKWFEFSVSSVKLLTTEKHRWSLQTKMTHGVSFGLIFSLLPHQAIGIQRPRKLGAGLPALPTTTSCLTFTLNNKTRQAGNHSQTLKKKLPYFYLNTSNYIF